METIQLAETKHLASLLELPDGSIKLAVTNEFVRVATKSPERLILCVELLKDKLLTTAKGGSARVVEAKAEELERLAKR